RATSVGDFGYRPLLMTPSEKNIVKSLVVVAWADGSVKEPEIGMIDSLLWAFGASDEEEAEIKEFAKKKRTIKDDVPLNEFDQESREVLLAHAALLTHADGKQTKAEEKLLKDLSEHLGFSNADARPIIEQARERAEKLAGRV
ncbi:MAG TPA: TerB family tellurite resistance protein, partial [Polyangiaceae bacterium]